MDTNTSWDHFQVTYGSHLYGTSTPTSDIDEKVIYVPSLDSLLLGYKPKIYKLRYDADGNPLTDTNVKMPDGGREVEYIPVQDFVRHFVSGQTYAIEIAYAYLSYGTPTFGLTYTSEIETFRFIDELVRDYSNSSSTAMVGFAKKQTMDYVHRGERLNFVRKVLGALKHARDTYELAWLKDDSGNMDKSEIRLNSPWTGSGDVLDYVVEQTGLKAGTNENNGKVHRTLEMNGRSYMDTTTVNHLITLLEKVAREYGERSVDAATTTVEWKSLAHAVRVYEQVIELLDTGNIVFPRPNAAYLLQIKRGEIPFETVKEELSRLQVEVDEKTKTTKLRPRTPELDEAAEFFLLRKLHGLYNLSLLSD